MTLPSTPNSTPTAPAPAGPATAPPVAFTPPTTPVRFPLDWLLAHAGAPIRYRALTEVARLSPTETAQVSNLPFTHAPALLLAVQQGVDGTWEGGMLALPSPRAHRFEGIGTIPAVRRLLELGWSKDTPPLVHARRALFRLLAEDDDPTYLYELAGKHRLEEDEVKRGRQALREAAAAVLAQAGYEGDPRLRGAARRILTRIADYLRSPLAQKPFIRQGNQHMLAAEAAPPSLHAVMMLAHMPLFRAEHHREMDALYTHLTQSLPRQEAIQLLGGKPLPVPHLVLGDMLPHRNAADADVAFAFFWLELMARLGFLRRNENWCKLFERFLEDRDREGVWHPHTGMDAVPRSSNPHVWPTYPLEPALEGEARWTDFTFRLGLIARLTGRPVEIV